MNIHDLIKWHAEQLHTNQKMLINLRSLVPTTTSWQLREEAVKTHTTAIRLLESMVPKQSATIDSLPGQPWNAHAVLHDALNRCDIDSPIMVLWLDKREQRKHSISCNNMHAMWLLNHELNDILNATEDDGK